MQLLPRPFIVEGEAHILNLFYLLPFFTQKIDCAVVVVCDPDVALKRVQAMKISSIEGFTNSRSLKDLYEQFCKLYQRYHPIYPQITFLDTTSLTPQKMVQRAADIVLSTLSCNRPTGA